MICNLTDLPSNVAERDRPAMQKEPMMVDMFIPLPLLIWRYISEERFTRGFRFPTLLAMSSFMSEFLSAVLEAHFSRLMNQGKTLITTQAAGEERGDQETLTGYGKFE